MFFLVAAAILTIGIAFKPEKKLARTLSESDLARIQPAVQARRLDELSKYVTDAAESAASDVVYLEEAPHTAVQWNKELAVTAAGHSGSSLSKAGASGAPAVALSRMAGPAGAPVEFWRTPEAGTAPVLGAPTLNVGEWTIAVARSSGNQTISTHGSFGGTKSARCGAFEIRQLIFGGALSPAFVGGGVFTLKGALAGVVAMCDGEPTVISAESVADLLQRPVFITDTLEQEYGFRAEEFTGPGAEPFVRVTAVWNGKSAGAAGLRPGDVLVTVGPVPVHILADLDPLRDATAEHTLKATRAGKLVTVTLDPAHNAAAPRVSATANGLTISPEPGGARLQIAAIAPYCPWLRSGIQPGDVLLSVNHAAVRDAEQALRALTLHRRQPVSIEIERGSNTAEVVLANE